MLPSTVGPPRTISSPDFHEDTLPELALPLLALLIPLVNLVCLVVRLLTVIFRRSEKFNEVPIDPNDDTSELLALRIAVS